MGRFYADNLRLRAQPASRRVVFIGDAITSEFNLAKVFFQQPYVNPRDSRPDYAADAGTIFARCHQSASRRVVVAGIQRHLAQHGPQTLEMIGDNIRGCVN